MNDLTEIEIYNLGGGLVTVVPDTDIQDNEIADGKNIFLDQLSRPKKRPGVYKVIEESAAITGMHIYNKSGGSYMQLYIEGTNLKYRLPDKKYGILVYDQFTAGLMPSFETIDGVTYITNGTDDVIAYNQSIVTLPPDFPKGKGMFKHEGRLMVYNFSGNGTNGIWDYPPFVCYTDDDWITTKYINVGQTDGTGIQFGASQDDRMVLWKDDSVWTVTFDDTDGFRKIEILKTGTRSPGSVVFTGNDYLWLDETGNAIVSLGEEENYNGRDRTEVAVSRNIKNILGEINKEYLSGVVSEYHEGKCYWAVPRGASTVNNQILIFDVIKKVWLPPMEINVPGGVTSISTFIEGGKKKVYYGYSTGKIYRDHDAYTDDGNPIESFILTKKYHGYFREEELRGIIKQFYTLHTLLTQSSSGVSQKIIVDQQETTETELVTRTDPHGMVGQQRFGDGQETIDGTEYYYALGDTLYVAPATADNTHQERNLNLRGYTLQLRYSNNVLHRGFTLQGFIAKNIKGMGRNFQSPAIKD